MPSVRASDGQRAGAAAEHRPAAGHVVELHDALGDVERVVVRQRHDAGAEPMRVRALARRGEEHLRRGDHLPAAGVVLAAPELVVAELVEVRGGTRGRAGAAASGSRRAGGGGRGRRRSAGVTCLPLERS